MPCVFWMTILGYALSDLIFYFILFIISYYYLLVANHTIFFCIWFICITTSHLFLEPLCWLLSSEHASSSIIPSFFHVVLFWCSLTQFNLCKCSLTELVLSSLMPVFPHSRKPFNLSVSISSSPQPFCCQTLPFFFMKLSSWTFFGLPCDIYHTVFVISINCGPTIFFPAS